MRVHVAAFLTVGPLACGANAANLVLNPGFETNSASSTQFNLSNSDLTTTVSNVTGFGGGDEIDLITTGNGYFFGPLSDSWSLVIHDKLDGSVDAFSIQLSTPLVVGATYHLSLNAANARFETNMFEVGTSLSATGFGSIVFSGSPAGQVPTQYSTTFVANSPDLFLTIRAGETSGSGTTVVDNFSLTLVPEPASALLLSLGLLGFAARRRRIC